MSIFVAKGLSQHVVRHREEEGAEARALLVAIATLDATDKGLLNQLLDLSIDLVGEESPNGHKVTLEQPIARVAVASAPGFEEVLVWIHPRNISYRIGRKMYYPSKLSEPLRGRMGLRHFCATAMSADYDSELGSGTIEPPPSGDAEGRAMNNRIAARLFEIDSQPVLIGRFEVIESIGAGGMGVVYRARDPRLGREVALKLLHPEILGGEIERARLLREAQALAQLSHPNVVQLYEVGEHDEGLFLAMEYVPGQSLRRWQASGAHGWRELVSIYIQAGQGLAAAHDADLVHRDFKPDNCIIDGQGRVRVLDFGLVRAGAEEYITIKDSGVGDASSSLDPKIHDPRDRLTDARTILGTLVYMPPEQLHGRIVDARADQFSFCVALYEALHGERPYAGETFAELESAYARGESRSLPKSSRVPKRVRDVLRRGFAVDSQERWSSMHALLDELERLVAPKTRPWLALGVMGGMVAIGVGLARDPGEEDRCVGSRAELEEVWNEGRKQAVKASILATELSYASGVWERVEPALEKYADAWVAQLSRTA